MNDYGFELLSDTFIDIKNLLEENDLFTTTGLLDDIQKSMNSTEMAKRPSPFAFPILVDRLREQLTSEKLEDRVKKMIKQYGVES